MHFEEEQEGLHTPRGAGGTVDGHANRTRPDWLLAVTLGRPYGNGLGAPSSPTSDYAAEGCEVIASLSFFFLLLLHYYLVFRSI